MSPSHNRMVMLGLMLMLSSTISLAANTPCSGRKGGIAGCDGAVVAQEYVTITTGNTTLAT